MAEKTKKHRGRIQAQGGGVEESEAWAQDEPLKISTARSLFQRLIDKLLPTQYKARKRAFRKAKKFAEASSENGGIFAIKKESFYDSKRNKSIRVDVEVLGGKAFVKDDENKKS
jgi:hypothetical protein